MLVTREYSSDLGELPAMRAFVREYCRRNWLTPERHEEALELLVLALQEAATNIIRHAYQNQRGNAIKLELATSDGATSATLYHSGREFDPAKVPPPSFDGSREGGFGVYLIEKAVDEVRYLARDESGCCGIRLVKKQLE